MRVKEGRYCRAMSINVVLSLAHFIPRKLTCVMIRDELSATLEKKRTGVTAVHSDMEPMSRLTPLSLSPDVCYPAGTNVGECRCEDAAVRR